MDKTFGEVLFSELDTNEYLNELYSDILYNYSLTLFRLNNSTSKEINISHALRFADILSKSIVPEKAEKHKIWAQEIIALLHSLYPNDSNVQYYFGSVLLNTGNFRGLELHSSPYAGVDLFDYSYNEYMRDFLRIPADPSHQFFKSQKNVYDNLGVQYFSYSGPTSMGKSFVMRMFIKEQIVNAQKMNFAIIVPTKALINEVSSKIIDDLKELLAQHDYRVVTSAGALSLQQQHNFILVLTPERFLYLLLDIPSFKMDFLFIDEAHKISSKDSRSPFYYKVIDLVVKMNSNTHIVFSSPNIPNPEVYLGLIPNGNEAKVHKLASTYSPVSQMKYLVDLVGNQIKSYNDYNCSLTEIIQDNNAVSLCELISTVGGNSQNIVYCSSTAKAVGYALDYASLTPQQDISVELKSIIKDIKSEIHGDYYLAEVLSKGVAYHIGYLPSEIRMRIEDLFKQGIIKTVFCTSTLVEGVNLPADNLFITSYKNGLSKMTPVDFKNLIGRVGRIEYNLYGNVFFVRTSTSIDENEFVELLQTEVPAQKLSLISELSKGQKKKIIESLLAGNIELLKHPKNQTPDNYSLMRRFAIILLRDIMKGNDTSVVKSCFSDCLNKEAEQQIKDIFSKKTNTDDDINISVDQIDNLYSAILKGLKYPDINSNGNFDYKTLLSFLERLCEIFKWDIYESKTLGHKSKQSGQHGKLKWYAVILSQWMSGNGLSLIMNAAIEFKQNNSNSEVEIDGQLVKYEDTKEHRNAVISATLNAIEDVILFRISSYFLRFSLEYKKFHNLSVIQNDWYEYVEYGTTNPLTIFLQRNGFSRETSTYIKQHKADYVMQIDGELRIKNSLLNCQSKSVCREAEEIKYNIPELFAD